MGAISNVETRGQAASDRHPPNPPPPGAARASAEELLPQPALDEDAKAAAELRRALLRGDEQVVRQFDRRLHIATLP
jgi:hypothetical protein